MVGGGGEGAGGRGGGGQGLMMEQMGQNHNYATGQGC